MKLAGIFAPLTTPFSADGAVDLGKLRDNISRYNATGLAGYVSIGSTGESVLLSFAEIERIWAATREAAAPGKLLIAGTGVETTAETIARTRRAAELGYQAALVKTPHYFKQLLTPAALEQHYRRVADASPIPVLIYSIPQYTGIAIAAEFVARLAQHPNIAGIKDSSGNIQFAAEVINLCPPEFQVLVGSTAILFPALALGAAGGILAMACCLPEMCVEIYDSSRGNDVERATRLQRGILSAARTIGAELGPAGVKYAMDCLGYFGGEPRRPLLPLTAAQKAGVEAVLAALAAPRTAVTSTLNR